MEKMFVKMEGVRITWVGELPRGKERKMFTVAQGCTISPKTGYPTNFDFGGPPDVLKSLVVGDAVTATVAIRAYSNQIYLDMIEIIRGNVNAASGTAKAKI